MFNPQFNFGSKIDFENKKYKVNEYMVKIMVRNGIHFIHRCNFMDLKKGDIFKTYNVESNDQLVSENGYKLFRATSNIMTDEIGVPYISVKGVSDATTK